MTRCFTSSDILVPDDLFYSVACLHDETSHRGDADDETLIIKYRIETLPQSYSYSNCPILRGGGVVANVMPQELSYFRLPRRGGRSGECDASRAVLLPVANARGAEWRMWCLKGCLTPSC